MDENNEFDIYDDLDVFDSNEKQQEKSADYVEIRNQLSEAQEEIRRLQEENASLKERIVNHEKVEGTLERNSSSLLITAKAELKRREREIHELRKEKDDIAFRRRDKLQKLVMTHNVGTQSQITCKPFVVYELKRIDDTSTERNHRRDENQTNNSFAKSKENISENKANHKTRECFAEKNGNHRSQPSTQTRHQDDYNLRGKHTNQRSKDDERPNAERANVERSKRRRSRSASKDRKKARRSRSREQQQQRRRRDRNNHERNSPDKPSRNQRGKSDGKECQSPKRSTNKPELDEKHHSKRKPDENISKRHSSKDKFDPNKRIKNGVKEMEIYNQSAVPDDNSIVDHVKRENKTDEKPINTNCIDMHGDDTLEEGEIDEHHDDMKKTDNKVNQSMAKAPPAMLSIANSLGQQQSQGQQQSDSSFQLALAPSSKDNTLKDGSVAETTSNVQGEIDVVPSGEKTESMDVDTPVEMGTAATNNKNDISNVQEMFHKKDLKQEIKTDENPNKSDEPLPTVAINETETPNLDRTTPSLNNSISLTNEHDESKQTTITANNLLDGIHNGVLNTSGNKSVKNISTSSKDYLIVEDENNETTIYVTRKKKKKKKKSLENATV